MVWFGLVWFGLVWFGLVCCWVVFMSKPLNHTWRSNPTGPQESHQINLPLAHWPPRYDADELSKQHGLIRSFTRNPSFPRPRFEVMTDNIPNHYGSYHYQIHLWVQWVRQRNTINTVVSYRRDTWYVHHIMPAASPSLSLQEYLTMVRYVLTLVGSSQKELN
jgi:hypothetical protein